MDRYRALLADFEAKTHIARLEGVLIGAMLAMALYVAAARLPASWLAELPF